MNRNFLIVIILIAISVVCLYGMKYQEQSNHPEISANDTLLLDWEEQLSDSLEIPLPAINMAINGYHALQSKDLLKNDSLIAIIDFSSPSTHKRFFVLDIKNKQVIKNTWVAHGMKSGENMAESFSNRRHSNKSSLGLYLTQETYEGKHGYSLRLKGMSKGLNDHARKRAIVIHGANYVSHDFILEHGRLGRSFGCPAVPMDEVNEIIDLIKEGACLFIYHPDAIPISTEDLEKLP
ncbi:MAG: murein L,D-transpeptidase catalytic domain family protein [Bacteroidetes bacterium]|nr:murein L,D-transpeptidase catalytic domain family protein [Bacteroidota bacterium]